MIRKELPPAQQAELRFLRQQADFWMEAQLKTDASPQRIAAILGWQRVT